MRVIVTGDAGFIGFHTTRRLLEEGHTVTGIDALTPYYDVSLKERRLEHLRGFTAFEHHTVMLEDAAAIRAIFERSQPDVVIHLAAQAGVRYSIEQPRAYIDANVVGSFNILEACRHVPVRHLLMASTSSAYGANEAFPFTETDKAVHPITLYAATKGAMELMGHCYSHLFRIPMTAFRFFTVYGPWGRPDMAYFLFTKRILAGEPIEIFNNGESYRDFTYIDDLVSAIRRLVNCVPPQVDQRAGLPAIEGDTLSPVAPYRLVNIGAGRPEKLTDLVAEIERALGLEAKRLYRPLPAGDVVKTFASAELLDRLTGDKPSTPLSVGIPAFVSWYRRHFN
ncbi:MAG: NAD-dependent epimerase/dehydratase family protein [Proteobacteria bacterium]|nr:NAD-dependent epimerase/dehydratase family protein [Pseudomonadota bacterium]